MHSVNREIQEHMDMEQNLKPRKGSWIWQASNISYKILMSNIFMFVFIFIYGCVPKATVRYETKIRKSKFPCMLFFIIPHRISSIFQLCILNVLNVSNKKGQNCITLQKGGKAHKIRKQEKKNMEHKQTYGRDIQNSCDEAYEIRGRRRIRAIIRKQQLRNYVVP